MTLTAGGHNRQAKRYLMAVAIVVVLLVGLRLALPGLVKNYVNGQLASMGDYSGRVDDVDIALWRGAYSLHDVEIVNVANEAPVPFFAASTVDLSVSWLALLDFAIVADVVFTDANLHFVDSDSDSDSDQDGSGTDWRQTLQDLVSIRINELDIENGALHFHNFESEPPVDLSLTELNGSFTNLSNADRSDASVSAGIDLEGLLFEHAPMSIAGNLDPLGDFHDFDIALRITAVELQQINDFTEAYGNFDFESGQGDLVMELTAVDGELDGYARPLLDNVSILNLDEDLEDGVLSAAWEALVGGLGRIFRNQPEDRIASQIEIQGTLEQQDISAWQAFVSILRNAFVEAYQAQFGRE